MPANSISRSRWGSINRPLLAILASLALLGVLAASLIERPTQTTKAYASQPLVVYCAASNKSVI